jgi:hypothetical protein
MKLGLLDSAQSWGLGRRSLSYKDRGDRMNDMILQITALGRSLVLGAATIYSIRLYLEI